MKVYYVAHGNYWGSTWPYEFIDNYIINALKELGHEVGIYDMFYNAQIVSNYAIEYSKAKNLQHWQMINILDYLASNSLTQKVMEFGPDIIVHIVGRISENVLKSLKKLNMKTILWCLDDPQEIGKTSAMGTLYDYVYTVESACVDVHKSKGSFRAEFLPLACDPKVHKSMDVEDKYKSDICFIGVPFPKRIDFFDSLADFLKDYNVKIIGGGPNIGSSADPWLWKRKLNRLDLLEKFIIDEVVHPQEAVKYYNGAKINLNIHRAAVDERFSATNADAIMPESVSGRTFELAGCAAFQLIDSDRKNFSTHFIKDKEIVAFTDENDFKEKIRYYLSNNNERKAIALEGQKKAYKEHTYINRLKKIIDNINK